MPSRMKVKRVRLELEVETGEIVTIEASEVLPPGAPAGASPDSKIEDFTIDISTPAEAVYGLRPYPVDTLHTGEREVRLTMRWIDLKQRAKYEEARAAAELARSAG